MGIPGSKLHLTIQGALIEHLCIRSTWLREKTQATSLDTVASATEAALIKTSKTSTAYATASTDCRPVVAGVLPIGLYIQRRIHRYSKVRLTFIEDAVVRVED